MPFQVSRLPAVDAALQRSLPGAVAPGDRAVGAGKSTPSFAETMKGYLQEVAALEKAADEQVRGIAAGEVTDVHQVMLAVEEANLALDLLIEIRNRLLDELFIPFTGGTDIDVKYIRAPVVNLVLVEPGVLRGVHAADPGTVRFVELGIA